MKESLIFSHSNLENISLDISYEKKLNNNEHSLLLFFLEKFEKDPNIEYLELNIPEIKSIMKTENTDDILDTLNRFVHKYLQYSFVLGEETLVGGFFPIISSVQFNSDLIFFYFNTELVNSFSKKSVFNKFHLPTLMKFRVTQSIKLYQELVKYINNFSSFEMSLDKIKELFSLSDSYDRFYDFEKNILQLSIKEINEYSLYHVEYEKIKTNDGKTSKVISLKFRFFSKNMDKVKSDAEKLFVLIKDQVIDSNLIMNSLIYYINEYDYNYVLNNVSFAIDHSYDDFDQYLLEALKNNYYISHFKLQTEKADRELLTLVDFAGHFSNIFKLQSELYRQLNALKFSYKFEFVQVLHQLKEKNHLEFSNEFIKVFVEYNKIGDSYIKIYGKKK